MAFAEDADAVHPQIGKTMVLDSGTYQIRIGPSGASYPSHIINTVDDWTAIKDINQQPVIFGSVSKWDYILNRWSDLIESKMEYAATDHALILTEPFDITKSNREKMTELIFEELHCPAFYVSPSSLFSLYSTGRTSGCVLDFAYDCSRIVPVYEGYVLNANAKTIPCGGQNVSFQLANQLEDTLQVSKYKSFSVSVLEKIKEKYCTVTAEKKKKKKKKVKKIEYELPDGKVIKIKSSILRKSAKILFENDFVPQIYESVLKCDASSTREMFQNIVLCGGSGKIKGMKEKLISDLTKTIKEKSSKQYPVHIAAPFNKQLAAWHGASIFSGLSSFNKALITIKEYEECGAKIVHHKCF